MTTKGSATINLRQPLPKYDRAGLSWGLTGVAAFSLTVPLTRVSVQNSGLSALFVGSGRAVVAAILAALVLMITRQTRPSGRQWLRLAVVAAGVVVGFPLLTSYALTIAPASHGAVVIAILPAATAVASAVRARERPSLSFWVMVCIGTAAAIGFAAAQGGGWTGLGQADLMLFAAVGFAAVGYAEGGMLARELGAWQTVSWALIVASPLMCVLTAGSMSHGVPQGSGLQWLAFAYLAVVSMFLSFFAWFRGLAIGPMTIVSQVQLLQPVMSIAWAMLLLGEKITWQTVTAGLFVILSAGSAIRMRSAKPANDRRRILRRRRTASLIGPDQPARSGTDQVTKIG
ncbi:DMT family transporter [Mycobacterium sp. BMJ-28]